MDLKIEKLYSVNLKEFKSFKACSFIITKVNRNKTENYL